MTSPSRGYSQRAALRIGEACLIPLLSACLGAQPVTAPSGGDLSTAQAAGFDTALVRRLVTDLRTNAIPAVHSLVILRKGATVVEEYFNGSSAEDVHTLQSVSKSVTSALVGIAIDRGVIRGVHERVADFFPAFGDTLLRDANRAAQRIEHILTMRTGVDYSEGGTDSPHSQLNRLPVGWDRFWLLRPMLGPPGREWRYDSGGVITLSALFRARTGSHADSMAITDLFTPLGITDWRWIKNQEGHPHMGGGLALRARDIAKFGQLYLQRGKWGSTQVVPAAWVDSSFIAHVPFSPARRRYVGYGYLWWHLPPAPGTRLPIMTAAGDRGQFIFIVRELELVVVVTAGKPSADTHQVADMFVERVLPAVR